MRSSLLKPTIVKQITSSRGKAYRNVIIKEALSMLIYRKLKKALKEQQEVVAFLITNRVAQDSPTRIEATKKLQALLELNTYTDNFGWVKTGKTLEKVKAIIENDFDYEVTAQQLNTSARTLIVTFSRSDKVLKAKIEQPLTLIMADEVEEGVNLFRLGRKELELKKFTQQTPLLDILLKDEPTEPSQDYSVINCINALKFIKIYSKPQLAVGLEKSGEEYVNYLLYILLNPSNKYTYQRELILQYLNNEIKLDELVVYLTEFEEAQNGTVNSSEDQSQ